MNERRNDRIFHASKPILLAGAGRADSAFLAHHAGDKNLVAVDGGLAHLLQAGLVAEMLIGDMDSVTPQARREAAAGGCRIVEISDQNSTDLEKALAHCRAPWFAGFGFLDGRFDHALAALNVLVKFQASHLVLLVGAKDVMTVVSGPLHLQLPVGSRLSVCPILPLSFVRSEGLEWSLDGLRLEIGGQGGSSNRCSAASQMIEPESPDQPFVLITERGHLSSLAGWLSSARP